MSNTDKRRGLMIINLEEDNPAKYYKLPQEFIDNPKEFMEKEEKEYQERMKNLPTGGLMEFIYGLKEKGEPGSEYTSKTEIFGSDFRNYLQSNRTSIPFMKIRDYFYPPKED